MMKKLSLIAFCCFSLQACVVMAVADLAATAVVKTAGLAVDATVGTVKVVGGVVGSVLPGGDDKDKKK
jgi:hypothetical protein